MNYTNEYSKLPNQVMTRHKFKDVDNSVAPLINQIKTLQQQGNYKKVNEIIQDNIENLSQYFISAEYINAIDEENRVYIFKQMNPSLPYILMFGLEIDIYE